jgi:hypothetical protein
MKNSKTKMTVTMACLMLLFGAGAADCTTPPDGMYIGTTDQGRDFELRVTPDGKVDQWYLNLSVSCMYGSASGGVRTTISPACVIEEDGSFVCGSTTCPSWPGGINSEVGGVFSPDNTVTGTVEAAVRIGSGCCYLTTAYEAALFIEEVFADGFETGDCTEWSAEVP